VADSSPFLVDELIFAGESGGVRCCVESFSVFEIATICSWDARFEAQERFEIAL
jgi:hypothetical protein